MSGIRYRIRRSIWRRTFSRSTSTIERSGPGVARRLSLPAWIPGSYMIREFARNIVVAIRAAGRMAPAVRAREARQAHLARGWLGETLALICATGLCLGPVGARRPPRSTHGFFNATSVFLRVAGRERRPAP
jgi:predicted metalloprotease with PDZ domain